MIGQPEKSADGKQRASRSRVICVLIGVILIPIFYLLSVPWVVQILHAAGLYKKRGTWIDEAVSAYTYPSHLLFEMSDAYKAFLDTYGRFVRRTIEWLLA